MTAKRLSQMKKTMKSTSMLTCKTNVLNRNPSKRRARVPLKKLSKRPMTTMMKKMKKRFQVHTTQISLSIFQFPTKLRSCLSISRAISPRKLI